MVDSEKFNSKKFALQIYQHQTIIEKKCKIIY